MTNDKRQVIHLLFCVCFLGGGLAYAQAPASPAGPAAEDEVVVTPEDLETLDAYRIQVEDAKDNVFLYEERKAEYWDAVGKLPGAKIEWPAAVVRVTQGTVHLRHAQWGRTRIVLVHYDQNGAHSYGNLSYVPPHCASPSAYRYARHAADPELEIGLEIPLELAKTLRKDDLIQMSAYIEHVDSRLTRGNSPDTLIYAANLQARKYFTPEELDALEAEREAAAQAAEAAETAK